MGHLTDIMASRLTRTSQQSILINLPNSLRVSENENWIYEQNHAEDEFVLIVSHYIRIECSTLESLEHWRTNAHRTIWFKVDQSHAGIVPILTQVFSFFGRKFMCSRFTAFKLLCFDYSMDLIFIMRSPVLWWCTNGCPPIWRQTFRNIRIRWSASVVSLWMTKIRYWLSQKNML